MAGGIIKEMYNGVTISFDGRDVYFLLDLRPLWLQTLYIINQTVWNDAPMAFIII